LRPGGYAAVTTSVCGLRPAILVALLFGTLDAPRIFDLPYVLTQGSNGTTTLSLLSYQQLTAEPDDWAGHRACGAHVHHRDGVSFLYIRLGGQNLREMAAER
jgi:trehalose/maltose transport system permease protein